MTYGKIVQAVSSVGAFAVTIHGIADDERLTPNLARQALRLACDNDLGGLASDGKVAYRVFAGGRVRKLNQKERAMSETWKAIPGFEGYDVSDLGRVRSYYTPGSTDSKNRIAWHIADAPRLVLKSSAGPDGYPLFNLQKNGKSHNRKAHSLVMLAFVGPRPDGHCVCHYNGNPTDNQLSNLRYDTPAGNRADTARHRRERNKLPKKLISLRISKATEDKLRWLAERHGTQTEAVAVAIDRLYESDYNKERPMDNPVYSPTYRQHSFSRSELWDMFCGGLDIFAETADTDLETLTAQVTELRPAMEGTEFHMTDTEIAEAIREYAQEHVKEHKPYPFPIDRWAARGVQ